MQRPLLLLTLIVCLVACKKEKDPSDPLKKANIAYGTDPKQVLDLYLPANAHADSTKLLILIHGGSWTDGDKKDFDVYISEFQRRLPNYAFANINYRLYTNGQNRFPAQEEDVKAAVGFLMSKSGEFKFSKQFLLLGASAGGQLALLQGYKYAGIAKPQAIISFFGPTDFTHLYNNPGIAMVPPLLATIIGATPAQNAAMYEVYSPIHFVTGESAPTLLLQGGKDELVPVAQATRLLAKLNEESVPHEYIFYPNEGHGWTGPNLDDSFNKAEAFIRKHLP